jgi:hypothetical protein
MRRYREALLAGKSQCLPTGREHRDLRAGSQKCLDQGCTRFE